ncbi:MAG: FAD-dependent thymidylate synthase [Chitinivibrionales bacterium]|nr:FAD-dependent thymidylate synthase [Chitinivibrionales bacterium]MBD3395175.1 FAD-dependent thymidylate synthase [Chitinivibrionales bacterium]
MAHCAVPAAERILDRKYKVLDKGFVRLVDYLGSDARIVQAARVSYGKGTKTYRRDKGLINYLLRNDHTSPFEQVVFTFHVKLPIFVARQWIRHRTARVNEISGRYSVMRDEFYVPHESDIACQSADNKQGRDTTPVSKAQSRKVLSVLKQSYQRVYGDYEKLLRDNIARELARINLPLGLYTEWYWQIDLHNAFHFFKLRLDPHAQREIRRYAEVMYRLVAKVCPMACDAFEEHVREGIRFSTTEMTELRRILTGKPPRLQGRARDIFVGKLGFDPVRENAR